MMTGQQLRGHQVFRVLGEVVSMAIYRPMLLSHLRVLCPISGITDCPSHPRLHPPDCPATEEVKEGEKIN